MLEWIRYSIPSPTLPEQTKFIREMERDAVFIILPIVSPLVGGNQ
jgi:hypothetical protein